MKAQAQTQSGPERTGERIIILTVVVVVVAIESA